MKTKITKASIFFALITILATKTTFAQQVVSLVAIPPRVQDLVADPGGVATQTIKLKNQGDNEMVISAQIIDFIVNNDEGRPMFLKGEKNLDNRWAMSDWTTISPNSFILRAGETKVMNLSVVVPEDATPGGHYVAITYQPTNDAGSDEQTQAKIIPSVATLVYLIVSGDINENALVKRMDIPSFSEYGPIGINTEIKNLSDVHIKPQGAIRIHNWLNKLATTLALDEKNIFPDQSRTFENTWSTKWLFGRYKATLEAGYGTTGNALLATAYFWVIPWKIVILVLLLITLVVLSIIYFTKKKKVEIEIEPNDLNQPQK